VGYRIEYDDPSGKYEVRKNPNWKLSGAVFWTVAAMVLGMMLFWPEGTETLRDLLIPGDNALTVQALREMTDILRGGGSLWDAVYAFCHCVLHGA